MSESDSADRPAPGARPPAAAPVRRRRWLGWVVMTTVLCAAAATVWLAVERSRSTTASAAKGSEKGSARTAEKAAEKGAEKGAAASDGKSAVAPAEGRRDGTGRKGGGGPPAVVGVRQVRVGPMDIVQAGLGTVTPRNTVVVRSRVDGPLKRVLFREGEMVRAGQLLAEIDPAPYEVALQQATGALARDEAQLRNARVDLERFRTLLAQDSIARQQVDTQEALVRQYEGTLLANRAQVDNAKLQLSYTRITAPIAGRAGLRLVDAGNLVRAGDATGLVTIAQIAPITVVFPIPEDALPPVLAQLKRGARLRVEAWDRANLNRLANGILLTVDNQIDTQTGTVRLKAQFANADGALFPNQFVNVRLKLDQIEDAILVPPAAIQRGREGTFVYAVDDENRVRVVPVRPGPSTPEQVAVEGDLAAGTRVVIDGADRLRPGMRVEVADRTGQGKGGQRRRDGAKKADAAGAGPAASEP
ncbi:MAG: MdtA/MuxA family multidrug efflux RND transporter periplasmic adaptor subunit, partial [bacterium]